MIIMTERSLQETQGVCEDEVTHFQFNHLAILFHCQFQFCFIFIFSLMPLYSKVSFL